MQYNLFVKNRNGYDYNDDDKNLRLTSPKVGHSTTRAEGAINLVYGQCISLYVRSIALELSIIIPYRLHNTMASLAKSIDRVCIEKRTL